MKITLFFLLFICLSFFSTKAVFADESLLKISPALFEIYAKPPADIWYPFTIENHSYQPVDLKIGYKPFDPQASRNGNINFLQNGQQISGLDKKIFDKIQIVDDNKISYNTITLGPKQKERLRLHIMLQNDEPTSDYYFSLLFLQNLNKMDQNITKSVKKNQNSFSTLQAGIGTNILLAVGDKEIPQANINTFSTSLIQESGPVPFNLTIFNSGLHFIKPHGKIFIKNMFRQTIGEIDIPATIILADTARTIGNKLFWDYASSNFNGNSSDQSNFLPEILWNKSFLFGMYTATLFLSSSDNGPIYSRSINFYVFPLKYLLIIVAISILIYIIYSKIKKKLK